MFASFQPASDWRRTPAGRRAISLGLALLVHLLLLLLLLRLAPPIAKRPPPGGPTTIFTVPAPTPSPEAARRAAARPEKQQAAPRATRAIQPPVVPRPVPRNAVAQPWVLNPEIAGFSLNPSQSHDRLANEDAGQKTGSESGAGAGAGRAGDSAVRGHGSHGQVVYAAKWYREPTDAELAPYMPHRDLAGAWAEIDCRTVARFHVEDCEEVGQSPPGSGLSRALREAAFQFLVWPPRVDGKVLVGEWVRIHFSIVERKDHANPGE